MAPGISLDDQNAWDDTALIDSWDEALAEYKKYYSIQAQGKRLEDVLSEHELGELREEYGDVMEEDEEGETTSTVADTNNMTDHQKAEELPEEHIGIAQRERPAEQTVPGNQAQSSAAEIQLPQPGEGLAASMPQAILGTVPDENLKNLMMSWYYAGYYTGLYTGQQHPAEANP